MRNIKIEKNLIGPNWWKSITVIKISGDSSADSFSPDSSQEEKEKIIKGWKNIAVFETDFIKPFFVGFISEDSINFLKFPIETLDRKFGMRIGKDDVRFFVFDPELKDIVKLSIIEIVDENDPRYKDLPLY